jgi:mono/diheme cytochrome c family protein
LFLGGAPGASAFIFDLSLVRVLELPVAAHADQHEFCDLVTAGDDDEAFELAFEEGDELFEFAFNALDGGGANVGQGQRFTRIPRADLTGTGQWARHTPSRATGPNAQNCNACHNQPFDDGAGNASANVHRDPNHTGILSKFIQRNTPHVFAPGAIQRLAEEVSEELSRDRAEARDFVCSHGGSTTKSLSAKGIGFGSIRATRTGTNPCRVSFDTSNVTGVDDDLIVKPFQWKGSVAFLRDFNRGASHNELGMQAVEFVGDNVDGDGDGVRNEMTIGDMTALAIYLAAQPRPVTKLELNQLGLAPLTAGEVAQINRGASRFESIGCATCHRPRLILDDPTFSEPSQNPNYRDSTFPAGQNPISRKVDPAFAVTFDLTEDQPDNVITLPNGETFRLGSLRKDSTGEHGIVDLYGDLRRHNMGSGLAEGIDEVGTGASTFLTENLWGVGSTGPWMHDGRATTLTEAILEHGGEATNARVNFRSLSTSAQADVLAFLNNLILFKVPEE